MKTVALVQARMSSSRFPGKVIEPIAGRPSIVFLVHRARRANKLDDVAVVTSVHESDDPLVEILERHGVSTYRGPLEDVLTRYLDAAQHFGASQIVRLTGDCPLIDPFIIDSVVELRERQNTDYSSNIEPRTFPDGLDCECFTLETLIRAADQAVAPEEREHVTLWMRAQGNGVARATLSSIVDASRLRWTLDYPDDLNAIHQLVSAMRNTDSFDYYDMLRGLAQHPSIAEINPRERSGDTKVPCAAPVTRTQGRT